jgi:predicted 3-demethylubiquinone-9 3-methyltransferase (glyoxalase superfamily)
MSLQKITPFLWFEKGAEEAANFYISIFKNSKVLSSNPMVTSFEIEGLQVSILNGGPAFKLNEAFSFAISCETQDEINYYWEKLTAGGTGQQCGWLKDKFGVSWQVVPSILGKLLADPSKAEKVTKAFMQMKKFDIEKLKEAAV